MAVERADVVEPEVHEEAARKEETLDAALGPLGDLGHGLADSRNPFQDCLCLLLELLEESAGQDPAQVVREGAHIGRDGHFVVIENDDEILLEMARVVEALEGKPACESAVADDGNHFETLLPL